MKIAPINFIALSARYCDIVLQYVSFTHCAYQLKIPFTLAILDTSATSTLLYYLVIFVLFCNFPNQTTTASDLPIRRKSLVPLSKLDVMKQLNLRHPIRGGVVNYQHWRRKDNWKNKKHIRYIYINYIGSTVIPCYIVKLWKVAQD